MSPSPNSCPMEIILKMARDVYPNHLDLLSVIKVGERLEVFGTSLLDVRCGFVQISASYTTDNQARIEKFIEGMFDIVTPEPILGIGEPVIAMFIDNNWYRAIITEIINSEQFKIFFVDYGNETICDKDCIRYIPEEIRRIPTLAVQVTLQKDTGLPYTHYEFGILKTRFEEKDFIAVVSDIQIINGQHDVNLTLRLFFDGKEPDKEMMLRLQHAVPPAFANPNSNLVDAIDSRGVGPVGAAEPSQDARTMKAEVLKAMESSRPFEPQRPSEPLRKPTMPIYVAPLPTTGRQNGANEAVKKANASLPSGKTKMKFSEEMFRSFYAFQKEGKYTDIEFLVGFHKIPVKAHRMVFAANATRFADIEEVATVNKNQFCLPSLELESFGLFLQYIYGQEIELDARVASGVQKAARHFGVTSLFNVAGQYCAELRCDNAVTYFQAGHELAFTYILKNFVEVSKAPDFASLAQVNLAEILNSDELCGTEIEIFRATISWANMMCRQEMLINSGENIKSVLKGCLSLIRFPLMSIKEFTYEVMPLGILTDSESLSIFTAIGLEPADRENLGMFCKWEPRVGRGGTTEEESREITDNNAYWSAREARLHEAFLQLFDFLKRVVEGIYTILHQIRESTGTNFFPHAPFVNEVDV